MKEKFKTDCPICAFHDGEGVIDHILIKKLNLEAYVCDECNACWFKKEDISAEANSFVEFGLFMESKGLTEAPSEVTFLN